MPYGPEPTQSSTQQASGRGPLLAIGGAEDKLGKRSVLTEFVRMAGGPEARIAVIPTASSLGNEIVEVYDALFRKLGAAEVVSVRPESREDAHDPAYVDQLADVTGVKRPTAASTLAKLVEDAALERVELPSGGVGFKVAAEAPEAPEEPAPSEPSEPEPPAAEDEPEA